MGEQTEKLKGKTNGRRVKIEDNFFALRLVVDAEKEFPSVVRFLWSSRSNREKRKKEPVLKELFVKNSDYGPGYGKWLSKSDTWRKHIEFGICY